MRTCIYTIFTHIQGNSSFSQFINSKMGDCQIMAHKVKNVTYKNSPENGDCKGGTPYMQYHPIFG